MHHSTSLHIYCAQWQKKLRSLSIYLNKFTTSSGLILQLQYKNELLSFVRVSQSPLGMTKFTKWNKSLYKRFNVTWEQIYMLNFKMKFTFSPQVYIYIYIYIDIWQKQPNLSSVVIELCIILQSHKNCYEPFFCVQVIYQKHSTISRLKIVPNR